jgi:hypothetical protein
MKSEHQENGVPGGPLILTSNLVAILTGSWMSYRRGSRNPLPPDPLAFWRRYSA